MGLGSILWKDQTHARSTARGPRKCTKMQKPTFTSPTPFRCTQISLSYLLTIPLQWEQSEVKWASRWDVYLDMQVLVHLFFCAHVQMCICVLLHLWTCVLAVLVHLYTWICRTPRSTGSPSSTLLWLCSSSPASSPWSSSALWDVTSQSTTWLTMTLRKASRRQVVKVDLLLNLSFKKTHLTIRIGWGKISALGLLYFFTENQWACFNKVEETLSYLAKNY